MPPPPPCFVLVTPCKVQTFCCLHFSFMPRSLPWLAMLFIVPCKTCNNWRFFCLLQFSWLSQGDYVIKICCSFKNAIIKNWTYFLHSSQTFFDLSLNSISLRFYKHFDWLCANTLLYTKANILRIQHYIV